MHWNVSLVGRANVGKSSIFNFLTRSREALVLNFEGLTRDRKSRWIHLEDETLKVHLHDLGGLHFVPASHTESVDPVDLWVQQEAQKTMQKSDLLILVVDGRLGLHPQDLEIVRWIHRFEKKVMLVINKCESGKPELLALPFFELGLGEGLQVSAAHAQGLSELRLLMQERLLEIQPSAELSEPPAFDPEEGIVLLGRPNVGKSTLMNRLLGEERVIAHDRAGTTRESIEATGAWNRMRFRLVDTAGIRPKGSVSDQHPFEKLGIIQALRSVDRSPIVLLIMDAQMVATHQELLLLRRLLYQGKATLLVLNKSDLCTSADLKKYQSHLKDRLGFAPYLPTVAISASEGSNIRSLWRAVERLREALHHRVSTALLNRHLQSLVAATPPPICKRTQRRIRIKYIHQVGGFPLRFEVTGTQLRALPEHYKKYLEMGLRRSLQLPQVPLLFYWKETVNPFHDVQEGRER